MKRVVVLVIGLALALTGCAGGVTSTQSPVIGLTYIPNVQFSPFYVAQTDGAFAAAKVNPTLRHHGTSESLFTALVAGQEQFVVAGGDEMMEARSQGLDLVAVASYYHQYPAEVMVPKNSSITSLAGLRGATIGIPSKSGETWFALLVALQTAGLTQADVKIEEISYTQIPALTRGNVDAAVGFSNSDAVQAALSGLPIRTFPVAHGTVPLVSSSLITTRQYAQQHPDVVKGVVAGMMAGVSSVVKDPANAMKVSVHYIPDLNTPASTAAARATLAATNKLWTTADGRISGRLDPAQWSAMADFMARTKLTPTRQDPALAMSNTYQ